MSIFNIKTIYFIAKTNSLSMVTYRGRCMQKAPQDSSGDSLIRRVLHHLNNGAELIQVKI